MSGKIRRQLEKALIFIDDNLDMSLSASEIANQAHMSEFHFQRKFSSYMGETLSRYILHRRLEIAAQKLVYQKDMKVNDIASELAFSDHSYFSRVFKKHFDNTPVEFREGFDGNALGSDANRLFLKTTPSKYKTVDVKVERLPILWFNNKQTPMNSRDENYNINKVLKIHEAFNEVFDSYSAELFGIATHCDCDNETTPQFAAEHVTTMFHGAMYRQKQAVGWSPDWLKIESGEWAVFNHYGDYHFKYQTISNVVRSWLPDSGYELRNSMSFEVHRKNPFSEGLDDLITQIYIPIKKVG